LGAWEAAKWLRMHSYKCGESVTNDMPHTHRFENKKTKQTGPWDVKPVFCGADGKRYQITTG